MRGKRRICKGENFRTFVFSQLKVDKPSSLEGISQVLFYNESHFRIRRLYSLDNATNCTIPLFLKDIRNPEHARCTKKPHAPVIVLSVYHSQIFTCKVHFAKSSCKLHK